VSRRSPRGDAAAEPRGSHGMVPHSRPSVSEADALAVASAVRSGRLAQGPEVEAFERELAARLGVESVAAVTSGSAALELALLALGVGAGDEVIVPTYVCDALWHAGRALLWAGVGPRSSDEAWREIAERFQVRVALLDLVDRREDRVEHRASLVFDAEGADCPPATPGRNRR